MNISEMNFYLVTRRKAVRNATHKEIYYCEYPPGCYLTFSEKFKAVELVDRHDQGEAHLLKRFRNGEKTAFAITELKAGTKFVRNDCAKHPFTEFVPIRRSLGLISSVTDKVIRSRKGA